MPQIEKGLVISWLKEQEITFQDYINDVKKHKAKMLNPKVQSQVMASAGVIAFIHAQLDYLEELK